jgi:hypothetical protein
LAGPGSTFARERNTKKKSPAIVGLSMSWGNVKSAYSVVQIFVVFMPLSASDLVL